MGSEQAQSNRNAAGKDWWTVGAQKGVQQPPYVVRCWGQWWRTVPLSEMSDVERELLRLIPQLPFGVRRCMDHLTRKRKKFSDLPIFDLRDPGVARAVREFWSPRPH